MSVSCSATPSAAFEPLVLTWTPDQPQPPLLLNSLRDPAHPITLCTIQGTYGVRFISATEIGYVTNASLNSPAEGRSVIMRMSLTDLKPVAVDSVEGQVMDMAWSPDGSSVAYLVDANAPGLGSGSANRLWIKTGTASPRALTPLIPLFGRGGSISDETKVRFSSDGQYQLMVDTYVATGPAASPDQARDMAPFQIRSVLDGSFVWAAPSALRAPGKYQFATMAAWLHQADRLYYRDSAGVQTWDRPSSDGTIYPGLAWYSPSISPDDRLVAYTVDLDAQPHVEVRELATKAFRVIPGIRAAPFFLSSNLLFVAEYAPSTQYGPGVPPYSPNGRAVVIDLRTNVETPVPMINPIDYWPR
jgi:hypothetical protein